MAETNSVSEKLLWESREESKFSKRKESREVPRLQKKETMVGVGSLEVWPGKLEGLRKWSAVQVATIRAA